MSVEDLPRTIELCGKPDGDAVLTYIDERLLPRELVMASTGTWTDVIDALQTLAVRGAPAIGCAGAAAMALWICNDGYPAYQAGDLDEEAFLREYSQVADKVAHARPTAVNLAWAVGRITEHLFGDGPASGRITEHLFGGSESGSASREASLVPTGETLQGGPQSGLQVPGDGVSSGQHNAAETREALPPSLPADLPDRAFAFVKQLERDDEAANRTMGAYGAELLPDSCAVLTHCNAGSLATAFYGTALGVIYAAAEQGKIFRVYSDETRPVGQGVRLTAWELAHAGVPVTIICDNMAASLMAAGKVDAVVVGADRIAANGDVANKIGTYGVAVCARHHGIPFYVAAPVSTFDLTLESGADIPIEQRAAAEITDCIPEGAEVYNPAFDITPADLVTAIVTERGAVAPGTPEWEAFIARLQ